MTEPRRILVVKLGAVGDCLHTLSAVRVLRRRFPEAEIGWLVETKSQEVVLGHPDLTRVHVWNRKSASAELRKGSVGAAWATVRATVAELRAARYDAAIDFQDLFKSGFFAWRSGARLRIGFARPREANFVFTNEWVRPREQDYHMVRRYMALLAPLGVDAAEAPLPASMFIPDDKKAVADEFFAREVPAGRPVVAINPAASLPRKIWPAERFGAVADRLCETFRVVPLLIWGPGEEPFVAAVRRAMKQESLVAPRTSIKELGRLLGKCALYVGNDSGPMHIASAMGAAGVGLFGPTDPRRVAPWSPNFRAVEPFEPFAKHRPVDGISVDQVYHAAAQLLEKL